MRGLKLKVARALAVSVLAMSGVPAAQAAVNATPAASSQTVAFSVFLPLRNTAAMATMLVDLQNTASPNYHRFLTPAQFNAQFGPTAASISSVSSALQAQGFFIVGVEGRAIKVSGTASQFAHAFSTTLSNMPATNGTMHVVANSAVTMPSALASQGAVVVAFNKQVAVHKASQVLSKIDPDNRYGPVGGYWFTDLKQAYDYPSYQATSLNLAGQTVPLDGRGVQAAILISNDALDSDIKAMFDHENFTKITGKPAPTITHAAVDGGAPFDVNDSFEASLDVQEVLGGAPGASVTLVNIPDLTDQSIFDGYNYIDNQTTATGAPLFQLANSSFGGCEIGDPTFNSMVDSLYAQGNLEGITFVVSSGDEGGLECPGPTFPATASRFVPSVSSPAASPNATAVGGTNVITTSDGTLNSAYVGENALGDPENPEAVVYDALGDFGIVSGGYWGAGGGLSTIFPKPYYQDVVSTGSNTARTLPDVGMQVGGCPGSAVQPCGPNRSYVFIYDGQGLTDYLGVTGGLFGVIGTSVSSPEFVGALALYVELNGPQGNMNPYLYRMAARQNSGTGTYYHRYIPGFDGKYTDKFPAGGYDYLVGNGTPDVRSLFGMTSLPAAGVPQTPSNP